MRSSGEDDMNWRGEGAGDVLQKPQSSKMVHQSALSRVVRGCRASAYVNARVCAARSQCTYAPWSGAVSAMCMCFSEARAGAMRAMAASSEGRLVGRAKASTWMAGVADDFHEVCVRDPAPRKAFRIHFPNLAVGLIQHRLLFQARRSRFTNLSELLQILWSGTGKVDVACD